MMHKEVAVLQRNKQRDDVGIAMRMSWAMGRSVLSVKLKVGSLQDFACKQTHYHELKATGGVRQAWVQPYACMF